MDLSRTTSTKSFESGQPSSNWRVTWCDPICKKIFTINLIRIVLKDLSCFTAMDRNARHCLPPLRFTFWSRQSRLRSNFLSILSHGPEKQTLRHMQIPPLALFKASPTLVWLLRLGGLGLILLGIADNSVIPLPGSMDVL